MPKNTRVKMVNVNDLHVDPSRIYEPMVEAFSDYLADRTIGRTVKVFPAKINVAETFRPPFESLAVMRPAFNLIRRTNEERLIEILVLERSDGSIWSYDDTTLVTLYQELAPGARVLCRIIGVDPGREP